MLLDLVRPFAYLTIRHPGRLPLAINWLVPVVLAASTLAACTAMATDTPFNVFGDSGLISRVLGFVQGLAGFYIAALAAIASFNSPHMDTLMPGTPPTLRIKYNTKASVVKLTRRRFLSAMFAFLTASSLVITALSIAALTFAGPLKSIIPMQAQPWFVWSFCSVYLVALFQLMSVTFWGLYYLGERVHTPDS